MSRCCDNPTAIALSIIAISLVLSLVLSALGITLLVLNEHSYFRWLGGGMVILSMGICLMLYLCCCRQNGETRFCLICEALPCCDSCIEMCDGDTRGRCGRSVIKTSCARCCVHRNVQDSDIELNATETDRGQRDNPAFIRFDSTTI